MKKILFLILFPRFVFGQEQSHDMITYDTLINAGYASITWRGRVTRPRDYFTANHPDTISRIVIFTIPGQGQMGTDYTKLDDFGPHFWLNNGWDGGLTLGNGKHYPILITFISSNTFMTGREVHDLATIVKNRFHPRDSSFHAAGLSQGAFGITSSILYESSAGNESGMKIFKSIVALHGASQDPGTGAKSTTLWGTWARKYRGRFFGLEGNGSDNFREVWRVSKPMNDTVPGSAHFSYTSVAGGGHGGWNDIYNPSNVLWSAVTPIGTYVTGSQAGTNAQGTYFSPSSVFQWMVRQGDTTLVAAGTPVNMPPTANAGIDQSVTLPISSVYVQGTGTDDNGIVNQSWTKISGPSTFTITSPSAQNTTIFGLVQGTYVFRYTTVDAAGLSATDDITVTVNAAIIPTTPVIRVKKGRIRYVPRL